MKIVIVALISLTLFVSCAHRGHSEGDCKDKKAGCAECSSGEKKAKPGGCKDCEDAEAKK
ncbi:MAG: hypothetical protein WA160_04680 [Pseudobdellovibrio sp.]